MIIFLSRDIYWFVMLFQLMDIFKWYLAIQLFGVVGFLLGYNIFASLKYRAYAVSKSLGLFSVAILGWFIFNKKLNFIEYSSFSIYLLLVLFCVIAWFQFAKYKEDILKFIFDNKKYLISIEVTFLVCFLICVLLRSYTPNIEGTEKPLEFVVINSILRSGFLPSEDAWCSGYPLNYYYLGQYIFCNVIKIAFINPSVAFNLINPTVLALILIGSFEFIYELTRKVSWSILAAFMTSLMGNLEPVSQILKNGWQIPAFRWWEAGHIIPNSFPEFPYWSFLHSDVHAHFLVHPFTLMFLFLVVAFIKGGFFLVTFEDFKNKDKFILNVLYCLVLGSFMLINSWNYPVALVITFAGLYIHSCFNLPENFRIMKIIAIIPSAIFYSLFSYFVYLAFYSYYLSPVSGIGIVDPLSRTTAGQFLMLLAAFLFPVTVFVVTDILNSLIIKKNISLWFKITFVSIPLLAILVLFLVTKSFVISFAAFIWLYFLVDLLRKHDSPHRMIVSSLMFLVFSLILACEFIYINDLFDGDYERQNTVAKNYIQLLLLLPMATVYLMYYISEYSLLKGKIRNAYVIIASILIILSSLFLFIGTFVKNSMFEYSYYEENWHIPTINGSYYIRIKYNGDYEAIEWLRENANLNDVVLEAQGNPYSYYGRVASHTGVLSLVNWAGSLTVLRGESFDSIVGMKADAVNRIYESTNKLDILGLLSEHKITYVFVGSLERAKFTPEQLSGFSHCKFLFKKVFEKGGTAIYKVIKR
jgi:YYY domain-containing protein